MPESFLEFKGILAQRKIAGEDTDCGKLMLVAVSV